MRASTFRQAAARIGKLACPLVLAVAATSGLAQTTSITADIPASVSGTYELTYTFGSTPFAANSKKTFVINGSDDTLCVDGKSLGKAFLRTAGAGEPLWVDGTTYFGLSTLASGAFNEINVYTSTNNNWVGQFTGSRTSTSTTCGSGGTTTTPTISADVQSIFDLAAQVYPTLMVNGGALGLYQGYTYRFFASSGIYVGIKDNKIFTMGGPFGNAIKEQGTVNVVLNALQTAKTKIDAMKPTTPTTPTSPAIPSGVYTLKVTGNVNMSFGVSTAINFTLQNMPAPSVNDTTVIVDQIKSQMAGVSGIANIKVTSINNTASRVTFRVEFTAVMSGLSVSYDLTYDYTR